MNIKTYSIIAATCHGNRGAQAMLETVVGRISDLAPGANFHVFSYYPGPDRALVNHPRVTIHSCTPWALVAWLVPLALCYGMLRKLFGNKALLLAPPAIRALGRSAALVDLAGVAFIDGREKFLPFNVLTLTPAWLLGTPVVKFPQALGPFRNTINRLAASMVLPRCAMIWARGAGTHRYLSDSGLPTMQFAQADDIAFNFEERWSLTCEGEKPLDELFGALDQAAVAIGVRGLIGICPSSVLAGKSSQEDGDYESILVELVCRLSRSGFRVLLFPNATRDAAGDAERNNDLPLMRRLYRDCEVAGLEPLPLMADFDLNAAGIKRLIQRMDVVLVSRFHAMVGALSLGVPPVVLGWSHKYAEVMARFGLEHVVMDYTALGAEDLGATIELIFEERAIIGSMITERLPEVKSSADRPLLALNALGAKLA